MRHPFSFFSSPSSRRLLPTLDGGWSATKGFWSGMSAMEAAVDGVVGSKRGEWREAVGCLASPSPLDTGIRVAVIDAERESKASAERRLVRCVKEAAAAVRERERS
ncbi:hypothetical protein Cni_G20148 [Canna indica]|uniref:Uncharacterized protein n=1 Tax=Canna indica TaxID=4628 RepID=A0AAQ3QJ79_9LILI|nr:hypothetical protein Cni_G20148 [Canna indica]